VQTVVTASLLFTPTERVQDPVLVMEDGRIVSVASRAEAEIPAGAKVMDFPGAVLAPGFVDIHVHGGAGHDVMQADDAAMDQFEALLAKHGVTSYCPTTVTAPLDLTLAALDRLAQRMERAEKRRDGLAQPLGMHLEGPFISHVKRGVHPPAELREPSLELLERMWGAARGRVRLMTVAPELSAARELIADAARRGVCVSIGHSDASFEQAQQGIAAGARHATHTFNAMRGFDHREPGILGAVLGDADLSADIICDGVHVHPSAVKIFLKAKGTARAVLITDAISATGCGDGRFRLGGFEVEVKGDRCEHEGRLAGSVLTMDRAVRNVMDFAGWELQRAVRLATLNPARVAGVADRKGSLAPGKDADVVVLSAHGEVMATVYDGRVVENQ